MRYLRPATVKAPGKLVDASWGGACVLWSPDNGCRLAFGNRPYQCRHLKPHADSNQCHGSMGKHELALAWVPYQVEAEAALDLAIQRAGRA